VDKLLPLLLGEARDHGVPGNLRRAGSALEEAAALRREAGDADAAIRARGLEADPAVTNQTVDQAGHGALFETESGAERTLIERPLIPECEEHVPLREGQAVATELTVDGSAQRLIAALEPVRWLSFKKGLTLPSGRERAVWLPHRLELPTDYMHIHVNGATLFQWLDLASV
jgi:hypothetical protein